MPRKKSAKQPKALAAFQKAMAKSKKRRAPRQKNPAMAAVQALGGREGMELAKNVGAGVGGYALTRLAGRIARVQLGQRWKLLEKHAGPLASILVLIASWATASKWKRLSRYQGPIVVGSGIAVLQSIIQSYLPGLSWLFDSEAPKALGQFTDRIPRAAAMLEDDEERIVGPGELETERQEQRAADEREYDALDPAGVPGDLGDEEDDLHEGIFST